MSRVRFGAIALALTIVVLSACEPRYVEVVVDACIQDGQRLKFCECTARGMKSQLGYQGYAVFSDLIILSQEAEPGNEVIVSLMAKHSLTPSVLTNIRAQIDRATRAVHAGCGG